MQFSKHTIDIKWVTEWDDTDVSLMLKDKSLLEVEWLNGYINQPTNHQRAKVEANVCWSV